MLTPFRERKKDPNFVRMSSDSDLKIRRPIGEGGKRNVRGLTWPEVAPVEKLGGFVDLVRNRSDRGLDDLGAVAFQAREVPEDDPHASESEGVERELGELRHERHFAVSLAQRLCLSAAPPYLATASLLQVNMQKHLSHLEPIVPVGQPNPRRSHSEN